jgi:hypothetical protein
VGTMALVPPVVDAVHVPVVAAGGISDGRGLLAALALGAAGAQMGTRFLLARESGAHPAYRKRLLDATEEDTLVTRAFTGRPARGLRNRFVEEYLSDGPEPLAWPLQSVAAGDIYGASQAADNGDFSPLLAGQGLRRLKKHDQGQRRSLARLGIGYWSWAARSPNPGSVWHSGSSYTGQLPGFSRQGGRVSEEERRALGAAGPRRRRRCRLDPLGPTSLARDPVVLPAAVEGGCPGR